MGFFLIASLLPPLQATGAPHPFTDRGKKCVHHEENSGCDDYIKFTLDTTILTRAIPIVFGIFENTIVTKGMHTRHERGRLGDSFVAQLT